MQDPNGSGVSEFKFLVTVETDTPEHAKQVMIERINYEEDLGFDYVVRWQEPELRAGSNAALTSAVAHATKHGW